MKRVLMTADPLGGIWNYAIELTRALPQIEFALCTMGAPLSPSQKHDVTALENVRPFASSFKLEWMDDPWADVDAAGEWLLEIAAQFQPDIIHLNGYAHAALGWRAPVILVAHSCVLSWWRAVKHEDAPARFREYRERVTAGLEAAEIIVAPSRAMLDSLRENYDVAFIGRVIYNGGNTSRISSATKQPRILAAGRVWDEAKNLRALDVVAPLVAWPIEIAGDLCAPGRSAVVFRKARTVGKLDPAQLAQSMASAAIFVAPVRYEPFGLSILEAALSGCALILGDTPSLRELWQEAAVFINPHDQVALANALNRLSHDDGLRLDLSRSARERASTFSVSKMAVSYRELYASCARMEVAA